MLVPAGNAGSSMARADHEAGRGVLAIPAANLHLLNVPATTSGFNLHYGGQPAAAGFPPRRSISIVPCSRNGSARDRPNWPLFSPTCRSSTTRLPRRPPTSVFSEREPASPAGSRSPEMVACRRRCRADFRTRTALATFRATGGSPSRSGPRRHPRFAAGGASGAGGTGGPPGDRGRRRLAGG